jgi:predicted nucleic acid-binding protein
MEAAARAFGGVLELAERHQLTTYDASYLELAQRLGLEIATDDGNLIQAAAAVRVPLFRA